MKVLRTLALAALFTLGGAARAHAAFFQPITGPLWTPAQANTGLADPSIVSLDGTPYVAAQTIGLAANDTVAVYRLSGGKAEQVGGELGIGTQPSLAVVNGTVVLAWAQGSAVKVRRLSSDRTTWQALPNIASGSSQAGRPVVASVGGAVEVAYQSGSVAVGTVNYVPTGVHVAKLAADSASWSTTDVVTGDSALQPGIDLADDGGSPDVVYYNARVHVSRFDGTSWSALGNAVAQVDTDADQQPSITVAGGVPFVAYRSLINTSDGTSYLHVERLNAARTAWIDTESSQTSMYEPFERPETRSVQMTSIDDVPYVAWSHFDDQVGLAQARVNRYNGATGAWEPVVDAPSPINTMPNSVVEAASITGIGGVPYVAYIDVPQASTNVDHKLYLSALAPDVQNVSVIADETTAAVLVQAQTYGTKAPLTVQYGQGDAFDHTVTLHGTGTTANDQLLANLTGLTAGSDYKVRVNGGAAVAFTTKAATPTPAPTNTNTTTTVQAPAQTLTVTQLRDKLVIATLSSATSITSGKTFTLNYLATAGAQSTLDVYKGSKRVARIAAAAKAGRNTIKWNGKVSGKAAAAGKYTLKLSTTSADGQTATASTKLTVKAKPKAKPKKKA